MSGKHRNWICGFEKESENEIRNYLSRFERHDPSCKPISQLPQLYLFLQLPQDMGLSSRLLVWFRSLASTWNSNPIYCEKGRLLSGLALLWPDTASESVPELILLTVVWSGYETWVRTVTCHRRWIELHYRDRRVTHSASSQIPLHVKGREGAG